MRTLLMIAVVVAGLSYGAPAQAQAVSGLRCAASAVLVAGIVVPVGKVVWAARGGQAAFRAAGAAGIRSTAAAAASTAAKRNARKLIGGRTDSLNWRITQAGHTGRLTTAQVRSLIPLGVRAGGPKSIVRYLNTRDLSHVKSVRNRPDLAASPKNLMFEPRAANRARGARDMTAVERARALGSNVCASLAGIAGL